MNDTPKPRRRRLQYSLRTLLLVMLLASVGMSWLAVRMQRARRQREAVEAIKRLGGTVIYEHESRGSEPPGPRWLRNLLGDDFFAGVFLARVDTDAGMEYLKALPQLQMLDLRFTRITDAGLEHLNGLPQLQRLDLRLTGITDAGLEHLNGLPQLQRLNLSNTPITDAGLQHLNRLPQLQRLDLGNTRITDAGLEHLKGLTQLEELWLDHTRVTDAGVEKLKQALPNCDFSR